MHASEASANTAYHDLFEHVVADYRTRTECSHELHQRARASLAGGVSGNLRYFSPYPLYIQSAQGCRTVDVDGNEFIDCFGANGPLLLGHNHPDIMQAVDSVRTLGSLPLNPSVMVDCAEMVQKTVPCAERVRFLNTGTEAVMTAVRIARARTGKSGIVKFHGHYHGQADQFLIGIDASDALFSEGVAPKATQGIHLCAYLDIDELTSLLQRQDDIAAVILDPAMHAGGLWGSDKDRLVSLRKLTEQHGVLLIFDEVISGCRLAPGGAQQYYGVTPDIVTMAKALAAGEKLALVAGRSEVMSVVDPLAPEGTPRVFQSGTVNDGPAALAASTAALSVYQRLYEKGDYERLERDTQQTKNVLEHNFNVAGMPCQVNQLASMLQIHLGGRNLTFTTSQGQDLRVLELFYLALINEGVMLSLPTSNHIYFSFAHSRPDFELIWKTIERVFERYRFDSLATD